MMQQYYPTQTRREYTAVCHECGKVHHFKANNFDGVKCTYCLAPLKMPPAPTERQEEISQSDFTTKEVKAQ